MRINLLIFFAVSAFFISGCIARKKNITGMRKLAFCDCVYASYDREDTSLVSQLKDVSAGEIFQDYPVSAAQAILIDSFINAGILQEYGDKYNVQRSLKENEKGNVVLYKCLHLYESKHLKTFLRKIRNK